MACINFWSIWTNQQIYVRFSNISECNGIWRAWKTSMECWFFMHWSVNACVWQWWLQGNLISYISWWTLNLGRTCRSSFHFKERFKNFNLGQWPFFEVWGCTWSWISSPSFVATMFLYHLNKDVATCLNVCVWKMQVAWATLDVCVCKMQLSWAIYLEDSLKRFIGFRSMY